MVKGIRSSRWGAVGLPWWAAGLLAIASGAIGLALARLPALTALIGLTVAILLVLTLVEPLVGLGVTLIFATFKPLTDYFVPQLPLDIGQIALIVTLGSWLLRALRRREIQIPPSPITIPLLVWIGAACLSILGALSLGYAVKELIKWLQILAVMWLVILEGRSGRWRTVLGMVIGAALLESLIGIWQFGIRGDGPKTFLILGDKFYRAYGTFEQPNPFGGFIGLTLPLVLGLLLGALAVWLGAARQRWAQNRAQSRIDWPAVIVNPDIWRVVLLGLLALILLAALIMSWSRGAWLGFGAVIAVLLIAWPRRAWIGALLVGLAVVVVVVGGHYNLLPSAISARLTDFTEFTQTFDVHGVDITADNYAVLERLAHWQAAEEMARYYPWTGVGIGNYEPVYPAFRLMNWPYPLGHAHDIYLNVLAETGIIGLLAYAALWITIFFWTWRITRSVDIWRRSVAVGLLGTWTHLSVHNLVDNLYVANIHLHLAALLGILTCLILIEKEAKRKS